MTSTSRFRSAVIQSKLVPPPLPEHLVTRPRLNALIGDLLAGHAILTVYATSGAGKTTAVHEALSDGEHRLSWLSVDDTEAAPGRLLTYLEAALGRSVPAAAHAATDALASGAPLAEAAGMLVEASAGAGVVLVLDELERVADSREALAVLSAVLRYSPADMRIVLVSRRELELDIGASLFARLAALREDELAFTVEEANAALSAHGAPAVDPQAVLDATGGWVAGVIFEAWRSDQHVVGLGGEADPLNGYLSSQILDQLPAEQRDFLITTAVLDPVTADRADALGIRDAGELMASLRRHRLPLTWLTDGRELRCQPRFREYLLECLRRRGERRLRALRTANARLLLAENHTEEAIEELLAVHANAEASPLIERTIGAVVERLDYAVAERWLAVAQPDGDSAIRDIAIGELMLAIGQQQYRRAVAVGDRLSDAGMRDRLARSSGHVACMLAWCYWHVGRLSDARAVADAAGPSPEEPVMCYLLSLCYDDVSEPAHACPTLTGGPIDALIVRLYWAHGRLDELRQAPVSRWADAVARPLRVSALLAIGQTDEATALCDGDGGDVGWLDVMAAVEVLAETGRYEEAWERLEAGRALIPPTGSAVLDMLSRLLEARLHLGAGEPQAALAVLDRLEETPYLRSYRWIAELADSWRGLVLLRSDPVSAAEILRRATASMCAGDRILELPRAAVYLAEAEWQAGNEEAADEAAALALRTAKRQGSTHRLLQALVDVPGVAARGIDAEADSGADWHAIGRVLLSPAAGAVVVANAAVELREFGELAIVVDGAAVRTRIRKCQELLAYVTSRDAETVSRGELLNALFDGRDDGSTRAYLRQAIGQLRAVLPDSVELTVSRNRVRIAPLGAILSDSDRFDGLVANALEQAGERRIETLLAALAVVDRGPYLPGVTSEWAEERRSLLARSAGDARVDLAETLFQHGRYAEAQELLGRALVEEPYSERGWRLRILLADAVGDGDGILDAYRDCSRRLEELGLEPSMQTIELVERLRG